MSHISSWPCAMGSRARHPVSKFLQIMEYSLQLFAGILLVYFIDEEILVDLDQFSLNDFSML